MEMLKEWNEDQKKSVVILKHFIEKMFERVEKRLKVSYLKVTKMIELFRTLLVDEHFYVREKRILDLIIYMKGDTEPSQQPKDQKSKKKSDVIQGNGGDYEMLDTCLESFEKGRKQMIIGAQELSKKIEQEILGITVKKDFKAHEKSIEKIYSQLWAIRKQVSAKSEKTSQKLTLFMKIYQDSFDDNQKGKRPKNDSYLSLLDYTDHILEIFESIKEMGRLTVGLWRQSKSVNNKRVEAIQNSFLKYFQIMQDTYSSKNMGPYNISQKKFEEVIYYLNHF